MDETGSGTSSPKRAFLLTVLNLQALAQHRYFL